MFVEICCHCRSNALETYLLTLFAEIIGDIVEKLHAQGGEGAVDVAIITALVDAGMASKADTKLRG